MNDLRSWIITLIAATLGCVMLERMAPEGNLQKYVRLICGLVITLLVATPVLKFLNGGMTFNSAFFADSIALSEKELTTRMNAMVADDNRQMLEIYRTSLIKDIHSRFEGENDYKVTAVDAVLEEDAASASYGHIRKLYISLTADGKAVSLLEGGLEAGPVQSMKSELTSVFGIDGEDIVIEIKK